MLDINLIRENPDALKNSLAKRGRSAALADDFLALDAAWREATSKLDGERGELNRLSKERKIEEAKITKERIKKQETEVTELTARRASIIGELPNILSPLVPEGKNEADNKVIRTWGEKPAYSVKDYLSLAEEFDLIDIARAAKVAGSRFGYLKREAALLEFALVQFAFNKLTKEGFIPVVPPVMLKPELYAGMGRLSKDQIEERYFLQNDNLFLAGSAEHTIGPMHADEVFEEKDLPRRYVGFSTCFRREAGSYGRDTRGILRVHQFDKVEMFSFVKPEDSEREHEFLLAMQEKLMQALELPYRAVELCAADIGFTDSRAFDIETWIPSENRYRETHSCSNTTDFQARGVNIKYKHSTIHNKQETSYVHMLNATGFAIGRMLIAILENCQNKKGEVVIPKALVKYAGFKKIVKN